MTRDDVFHELPHQSPPQSRRKGVLRFIQVVVIRVMIFRYSGTMVAKSHSADRTRIFSGSFGQRRCISAKKSQCRAICHFLVYQILHKCSPMRLFAGWWINMLQNVVSTLTDMIARGWENFLARPQGTLNFDSFSNLPSRPYWRFAPASTMLGTDARPIFGRRSQSPYTVRSCFMAGGRTFALRFSFPQCSMRSINLLLIGSSTRWNCSSRRRCWRSYRI